VVVASRIREKAHDFAVIVQAQRLRKHRAWKLKKREDAALVQETLGGGGAGHVKTDDHSGVIDVRGLRANQARDRYALYFTAGYNNQHDGVFGEILSTPKRGTIALIFSGLGLLGAGSLLRRQKRRA
jgi:hypothetical protein